MAGAQPKTKETKAATRRFYRSSRICILPYVKEICRGDRCRKLEIVGRVKIIQMPGVLQSDHDIPMKMRQNFRLEKQ